jgi:hypothetical protein
MPKRLLYATFSGKGKMGRQKPRWLDAVIGDIKKLRIMMRCRRVLGKEVWRKLPGRQDSSCVVELLLLLMMMMMMINDGGVMVIIVIIQLLEIITELKDGYQFLLCLI